MNRECIDGTELKLHDKSASWSAVLTEYYVFLVAVSICVCFVFSSENKTLIVMKPYTKTEIESKLWRSWPRACQAQWFPGIFPTSLGNLFKVWLLSWWIIFSYTWMGFPWSSLCLLPLVTGHLSEENLHHLYNNHLSVGRQCSTPAVSSACWTSPILSTFLHVSSSPVL